MSPCRSSLLFACGLAVASATEPAAPPPLEVLPQDILTTRTTHDGLRSVTVQQLDPAAMEDHRLALAPVVPPQANGEPPAEEGQEETADQRPVVTLTLGASVHVPDPEHPEQAVTRLQFWSAGRDVVLWIPANFLWLSGHGDFGTETVRYSVLMAVSEGSGAPSAPAFSSLPTGGFTVAEGEPTAEEAAAVRALLDFYQQDTQGLRARYEIRRAQAAAAAVERAANPPEKKNIILRYWRTDAAGIGAAREGVAP